MMFKNQDFLDKAKNHRNPEQRKWLLVGTIRPYDSTSDFNQVRVWALEGTPIRGFIIEWRDSAVRLDSHGKPIKTFHRAYLDTRLFKKVPNIGV